MNTAVEVGARIKKVRVTADLITAELTDGRIISVPTVWSWRLSEATAKQRANFRLIGSGQGIHWPDIDEDLSVEGMLRGAPAPRPRPARQGRATTRSTTAQKKKKRSRSRAARS